MGLVVSTDEKGLKIWKDEKSQYPRYSYCISRKNGEQWENCYQSVKFKKDVNVPNGAVIQIKTAFFSFDVAKDDPKKKYPYLMITDFDIVGGDIQIPDVPESDDEVVPFN